MHALRGRRIVITGVSRGIGYEVARRFLAEGAEVLGVAREPTRLSAARERLDPTGRQLEVLPLDLTAAEAPRVLARAVERRFGALDVLFNNAAVQIDGSVRGILEADEATFARALDINLVAPYRLCRALVPLLLAGREPRLVNVSSGAGNFESMRAPGIPTYRLSKWALNGLTMLLATELVGRVAVNAFDPGWVKTDLGGPNAPGTPDQSAVGALALVTQAFDVTGKFWKDGQEIPF